MIITGKPNGLCEDHWLQYRVGEGNTPRSKGKADLLKLVEGTTGNLSSLFIVLSKGLGDAILAARPLWQTERFCGHVRYVMPGWGSNLSLVSHGLYQENSNGQY